VCVLNDKVIANTVFFKVVNLPLKKAVNFLKWMTKTAVKKAVWHLPQFFRGGRGL
jgi:hypothetical protein